MEKTTEKRVLEFRGVPGKLDKWTHYGAGRRRVCPKVPPGLPFWKQLRLDQKLPFMSAPKGVHLSRGFPAERLLTRKPAHDFRLFDMYGHDLHTPYETLHNEYLKKHLNKDGVVARLQTVGLIGADGKVICSLKNINKFREMTRLMNLDHIHHEMNLETESVTNARRLDRLEEHFRETQYYWEMKNKFKQLREMHQAENAKKAQEALQRQLRKEFQKELHVYNWSLNNQEEHKNAIIKNAVKIAKVQNNLEQLRNTKRAERLMLKRKIRERGIQLQKWQVAKIINQHEHNQEKVKKRWEKKCDAMTQPLPKSQDVTEKMLQLQSNIERRKARAARVKKNQEQIRLHRLIMRSKRFSGNNLKREKPPKKEEEPEELGVVAFTIDFIIDEALVDFTKKVITPLYVKARRIAIQYGFFSLHTLRLERRSSKARFPNSITSNQQCAQLTLENNRKVSETSKEWENKLFAKGKAPCLDMNLEHYRTGILSNISMEHWSPERRKTTFKYHSGSIEVDFPEKQKLIEKCYQVVEQLLMNAATIIADCIEPTTQARTIKKLVDCEHRPKKVIEMIADEIYREDTGANSCVATGLAKEAVIAVLKPRELQKPKNELIEILRILYNCKRW